MAVQLQETLHLLALLCIAGAEVEDETGRCYGHAKRKSQVDGGRFVESWRVCEEPGGHDATEVSCNKGDGNRGRAAVMWLYIVRDPCGETGGDSIATYDLKV